MTQVKFPVMLDKERAKYVTREIAYEQTIKELRLQLEQAHADIAGLHDQLEEPQIAQDDYRLNKLELEQLRQQLAEAQVKIDLATSTAEKVIQLDYAGSVWMLDLPKIMQNLIEKLKEN